MHCIPGSGSSIRHGNRSRPQAPLVPLPLPPTSGGRSGPPWPGAVAARRPECAAVSRRLSCPPCLLGSRPNEKARGSTRSGPKPTRTRTTKPRRPPSQDDPGSPPEREREGRAQGTGRADLGGRGHQEGGNLKRRLASIELQRGGCSGAGPSSCAGEGRQSPPSRSAT